MLQQTTVATVQPRFERFVARWPTIHDLAAADDDAILSEWAGLGYYARARNLIACARAVVRRGEFPRTSAELRELSGIGAYTSAAIAAIAFGEKAAAIDTNVERVTARLHGIFRPQRSIIERHVLVMMPAARPGDFVQAMMDLGATLCRPKNPRCGECPLAGDCAAFASGSPEQFPQLRQRRTRPHRHGNAYLITSANRLWLIRRPARGLLGGMAALPGGEWDKEGPEPGAIATIRHDFTHFSLDLHIVPCEEPNGEGWWQSVDQLDKAGLPTLYRKAIDAARASGVAV